jgi:mannose-6-phosphate isomerase
VGESFEVADLEEACSVVASGPEAGKTLREVHGAPFPLLVKVLDAREPLSVQVHPDGRDGTPRKEEASVALADGGEVALGRVDGAVPAPGRWLPLLTRRSLVAGSPDGRRPPTMVHVPPGTVHAILPAALVWEVQTPVDVTWRLDDHGRTDERGRARALHLAEARAILARGPEAPARVSRDGLSLEGTAFTLRAWPPGGAEGVRALVAFLPAGGTVRAAGGTLDVPRARTVVLPPQPVDIASAGWVLTARVPHA